MRILSLIKDQFAHKIILVLQTRYRVDLQGLALLVERTKERRTQWRCRLSGPMKIEKVEGCRRGSI